jgi:transposase
MAVESTIVTLSRQGWSQRRIARELGVDRETVGRYVRRAASEPAIPPPGSAEPLGANPAILPAGPADPNPAIPPPGACGRKSQCQPHRAFIEQGLADGLSAQRIYQDLRAETEYAGSYDAVKRFVRRLAQAHPHRFERIECAAGEEVQVDFGRGAPIVDSEGRRRGTHVFRVVLSHSRKAYSEAVTRQTTETFIRSLENAFRYFGGVPKTVVIDNLRAAVTQADWYEPDLNPKIEAFCRHYNTVILPTRPYHPHHKGKIERAVGYVKNNALKRRAFESLGAQNAFLLNWEAQIADQRIHGTTRQQVAKLFEERERAALQPLPPMIFPCYQEARRSVHRDSYVEVQRAYYEVPEEYIGREVWVRWDSHLVRVFNQRGEQIAVHARLEAGQFTATSHGHRHSRRVDGGRNYLLHEAGLIGPHSRRWAQAMIEHRGPIGFRAIYGLLALSRAHPLKVIEAACEQACARGAYRLRDLRRLMEQPVEQAAFQWLEAHPVIRDMADYGTLVNATQPTEAAAV